MANRYYLTHHGIKGQKWGVRRFENYDGTLTPAGKERYGSMSVYYDDRGVSVKDTKTGNRVVIKGDSNTWEEMQQIYTERGLKDYYKDATEALKSIGVDTRISYSDFLDELRDNDELMEEAASYIEENMEMYLSELVGGYAKNSNSSSENKESKQSKPKYTQEEAINKAYDDLEKKYPNFNSFDQDKQDELFFDYVNDSGLYEYI